MKTLFSLTLLITLAGCASQRPATVEQVHEQALRQYVQTLPTDVRSGAVTSKVLKLHSRGPLADVLGMAPGAANGRQLRNAMLESQAAGDDFFLIIGASALLDEVLIGRAAGGQNLSGLKVFYVGTANQDRLRQCLEAAGADFQWIAVE